MSAICERFVQNTWKKDLCSNCFKSKEEHLNLHQIIKPLPLPSLTAEPPKGIMKSLKKGKHKRKVSFPKELSEVIGFGGEWSESDGSDVELEPPSPTIEEIHCDENEHELRKITKTNTDFNTDNGNLLGEPEPKIKKSFAALKLGSNSQKDKQPLQISVMPFGTSTSKVNDIKQIFNTQKRNENNKTNVFVKTLTIKSEAAISPTVLNNKNEAQISPDIDVKMTEKSLLEEISETLEMNKNAKQETLNILNTEKNTSTTNSSMSSKLQISNPILIKTSIDTKRTITRHIPIKKDQIKPKITVFSKTSPESSDGNFSDQENCVSAYYDVVESNNSYENVPDDFELSKAVTDCNKSLKLEENKIKELTKVNTECLSDASSKKTKSFFSSQLISDMFLSKKPLNYHLRKRSEVYNLSDRSYITSKITSDGLIVTKNSNEDVLDSSGSSFDSSSDEEMSSMNRSESDSGIGICVSNEYQNIDQESRIKEFNGYDICENRSITKTPVKQTRSATSTNSSDYEDIQVVNEDETITNEVIDKIFSAEKSRELAGEPDGRSDPDGSAEALPALPSCPPPTIDARKSFLNDLQIKQIEKPKVPTKPTVSVIKTFAKRGQNIAQQQVIMQLQQVMKPVTVETINDLAPIIKQDNGGEFNKLSNKKGRAPNPPPSPTDYKDENEFKHEDEDEFERENVKHSSEQESEQAEVTQTSEKPDNTRSEYCKSEISQKGIDEPSSSIYSRNPLATIKSNSPVVREKDKRERAIINPKFRSLNTFSSNRQSNSEKSRALTPEPAPRKSLSISQDSLNFDGDKKKKNKFSIKKFLRMGSNKNVENVYKKEGIYGESQSSSEDVMADTIPQVKPRLIIIHPLDINNSGVEVVKDIRRSSVDLPNFSVSLTTTVTGKPPAPPQRAGVEGNRIHDLNKPARPPPPKSAELRRKQKMGLQGIEKNIPELQKNVNKPDNVYANLGEVRSAIAPRKPERTASMREKDGQLELPRRRPVGQNENIETESDYSSNLTYTELGSVSNLSRTISNASEDSIELKRNIYTNHEQQLNDSDSKSITSSTNSYNDSFNERKKKIMDLENNKLQTATNTNKIELFEQTKISTLSTSDYAKVSKGFLNDGIKNSVQKMTNTIDSYLKDKMTSSPLLIIEPNIYDTQYNNYVNKSIKSTSGCNSNSRVNEIELRSNGYESVQELQQQQRSSLPTEQHSSIYCGSSSERSNGYRRIEQNDYNKKYAGGNLPRATSMSYCGSEMGESEIYSPYSFYGSEAGTDVALLDSNDGWGSHQNTKMRSCKTINRLRMRKGRSVVHKNLEDNYGAVVVANHEALAQVLEQLQQATTVPIALRPISNTINLRFEDFQVLESARGVVVGRRAFHTAIWANHTHVTLALTVDCNQISGVGGDLNQLSGGASGALNPITEFCDLVPSHYLPLMPSTQVRLVQATISVLPRMYVDTIQSLGAILKSKSQAIQNGTFGGSIPNLSILKDQKSFIRNGHSVQNLSTLNEANNENIDNTIGLAQNPYINSDELLYREVGFVLLQLVNGLKSLQATGIEEMPLSLSNVILCKEVENKEAQARLCVFQGFNQDSREEEEPVGTLCQCAYIALTTMLPQTKLTTILSKILLQERSESLSKIKSILEFSIWGPSDVVLTGPIKEREMSLQRWLDLERATVLHGLVRTRVELTVYDECHLMFLVRSNAKIMCEASSIMLPTNGNIDIAE